MQSQNDIAKQLDAMQEAMLINTIQTIDKWDVNIIVDKIEDDTGQQPEKFRFGGAYPNPFNTTTTLSFYLPESMEVSIDVFSVNGEFVNKIQRNRLGPGEHKVIWDANNLGSGQYMVRIKAGSEIVTQRVSLIK
jgi:hypothetical protein